MIGFGKQDDMNQESTEHCLTDKELIHISKGIASPRVLEHIVNCPLCHGAAIGAAKAKHVKKHLKRLRKETKKWLKDMRRRGMFK